MKSTRLALMVFVNAAFFPLLPVLYPGAVSFAQTEEPTTLQEVIVEAEKEREAEAEVKDRTAFVTLIEAEDYEETLSTVPELVEQSVGLTVRRFGGLGSFSTASIRGSSAEQVAILLDGVPLNRAKSGVVNLSNIPFGIVERIEVYRGVAPLRFRSSAIGGVINIVTKKPEKELSNQISGSYGSFDTWNLNASSSGGFEKWGYLVSGSYSSSEGDFEFLDDNGTPLNPLDDEITKRKNNDFRSGNLLGKLSYTPTPTLNLEMSNDYFDKDEGIPGISSNQSENARLKTVRNIFNLKGKKRELLTRALDGEVNFYVLSETTRFQDLFGEIGVGRQDNTNENFGWGADGYFSYLWGEHQILSFLGSFQNERFDSEDPLSPVVEEGPTQKRNVYQAGIEDEIYLWEDRLIFTPQLLHAFLDNDFGGRLPFQGAPVSSPDDEDFTSCKIGGSVQVQEGVFLKANAGRYFRFPNFSELFGDRGFVIGNPDLKSEKGVNWDAGLSFEKRDWQLLEGIPMNRIFLEVVYFASVVDDLIVFEQTSQRTIKARNVSSAEIQGVEVSWALDLFDHLRVIGNYTFQDTENTSDIPFLRGNQLPGRPEDELFTRIEIFNRWAKVFYEYDFIADNFLDQANFRLVEKREIHNAGLSIYPHKNVTLTFEVKNFTDEQVSDVLGFPLPGTSYFGTILIKF